MKSSDIRPLDGDTLGATLRGPLWGGVLWGGREAVPPRAGCTGLRVSTCGAGDFLKNEKATDGKISG